MFLGEAEDPNEHVGIVLKDPWLVDEELLTLAEKAFDPFPANVAMG